MDLNELLYHHQIALMAATQAHATAHIAPDLDRPCYYARRLDEYRVRRGLNFPILASADCPK